MVKIDSETIQKTLIVSENVKEFEERVKKLMGLDDEEEDYEEKFESEEDDEEPQQTLQPHNRKLLKRED